MNDEQRLVATMETKAAAIRNNKLAKIKRSLSKIQTYSNSIGSNRGDTKVRQSTYADIIPYHLRCNFSVLQ